jgi:hypothetical protein
MPTASVAATARFRRRFWLPARRAGSTGCRAASVRSRGATATVIVGDVGEQAGGQMYEQAQGHAAATDIGRLDHEMVSHATRLHFRPGRGRCQAFVGDWTGGVDPRTNEIYVLVPLAAFESVQDLLEEERYLRAIHAIGRRNAVGRMEDEA